MNSVDTLHTTETKVDVPGTTAVDAGTVSEEVTRHFPKTATPAELKRARATHEALFRLRMETDPVSESHLRMVFALFLAGAEQGRDAVDVPESLATPDVQKYLSLLQPAIPVTHIHYDFESGQPNHIVTFQNRPDI